MTIRGHAVLALALLSATAAIAGDKKPDPVGPNGEKLICRRTEVTGSLARTIKQCMTKAGWDKWAEENRSRSQQIIDDAQGRPPGN